MNTATVPEIPEAGGGPLGLSPEECGRVLDVLVNRPSQGIIVVDLAEEGRMRVVSQTGLDPIGMTPARFEPADASELSGRHRVFHSDGVTPLAPTDIPLARAVRGETVLDEEMIVVTAAGERVLLILSALPLRDSRSRPTGGVMTWRDVTTVREAEAQRERILSELREEHELRLERERLAEALNELNLLISSTLDTEEIFRRVVRETAGRMGVESVGVTLREEDHWVIKYASGPAARLIGVRATDEESPLTVAAFMKKKPMISENTARDRRLSSSAARGRGIGAFMVVPLVVRDKSIGVLGFSAHSGPYHFSEAQVDFAQKLATSVSLALENARLVAMQAKSRRLSDALADITSFVTSDLEAEYLLRRIVVDSAKALSADLGCLYLLESGSWQLKYWEGDERKVRRAGTKRVAQILGAEAVITRQPIAISNARRDKRVAKIAPREVGSLLILPFFRLGEVIGILQFEFHGKGTELEDAHQHFARKLGLALSLALDKAELYDISRSVARTLSDALLSTPRRLRSVEVGAVYRSATEHVDVGGDFYEVSSLPGRRIALLIGDVSGKGLEAASLAALAKNAIKAYAYEGHDPAAVLARANRLVYRNSPPRSYVTVFFGILDPAGGRLLYGRAGHPPPMIRRGTGEVELLEGGSGVLGLGVDEFEVFETFLGPEDVLVMYTDGVTEARRGGEFFQEEGLGAFLVDSATTRARMLPQALLNLLTAYSGGVLRDDVAVVAVGLRSRPVRLGLKAEERRGTSSDKRVQLVRGGRG
jgi:serine phosphatase RsbU (regulator of sigma subunit)/PAS domain-containing protein